MIKKVSLYENIYFLNVSFYKAIYTQDENKISTPRRFRRSDERIQHKVIETSVFVDYPLYQKYTVEMKKSLQELKDAVLAIINQVRLSYID